MRATLFLVLALLAAPSLAGCAEESTTGVFAGRVLDRDTNEPIPGAEVKVTAGSDPSKKTTTDGDGRYRLELAPGTWSLKATATAYSDADQKELVLNAGDSLTKDFFLAKVK